MVNGMKRPSLLQNCPTKGQPAKRKKEDWGGVWTFAPNGGYVVAVPSLHKSGLGYEMIRRKVCE